MLSVPPPTRVAIGTLEVGGQRIDLFLAPEWARYFQALNGQVQGNTTVVMESAQHTALLGEAAEAPDTFPAPPGPPGAKGDSGPALFMLQDETAESPMPGAPGAPGGKGDPGLALFMLQDDSAESSMPAPAAIDLAAPPAIGTTAPAAARFTTLTTTAGFGCNGKAAQTAVASGGTLTGVIAALVANGILSS